MENKQQSAQVSEVIVGTAKPIEKKIGLTNRRIILFWTQRFDEKEFTESYLKIGEMFKKTKAIRLVPQEDGTFMEMPIYSLKRGRRTYYTTDVTRKDEILAKSFEAKTLKARVKRMEEQFMKKTEEKKAHILELAKEKIKGMVGDQQIVIVKHHV